MKRSFHYLSRLRTYVHADMKKFEMNLPWRLPSSEWLEQVITNLQNTKILVISVRFGRTLLLVGFLPSVNTVCQQKGPLSTLVNQISKNGPQMSKFLSRDAWGSWWVHPLPKIFGPTHCGRPTRPSLVPFWAKLAILHIKKHHKLVQIWVPYHSRVI